MELERMQKNYGYFGGLSLLYGMLFAICLYHNINGITFPIWVFTMEVLTYFLVKKLGRSLKRRTLLYFAGMLLLGIGTAMTTSWFLIFLIWLGFCCYF